MDKISGTKLRLARMCVPKFLFSNIVELRLMIAGSRVAGALSFKDDVLG
jgi:hypothetical protein